MKRIVRFMAFFIAVIALEIAFGKIKAAGVTKLECQRVEPVQVDCRLTRSQFFGAIEVADKKLTKVLRAESKDDDVYLKTADESVFVGTSPTLANDINKFLKSPKTQLRAVADSRQSSFGDLVFISFVLLFLGVCFKLAWE